MPTSKSTSSNIISNWFTLTEPGELRYGAKISVWVRWCVLTLYLVGINYRVEYGANPHLLNTVYTIVPITINGFFHYRIWSHLNVTAFWLLVLSAMDIAFISLSVSLTGGLGSPNFVFYYLALAIFASMFASPRVSLSAATLVAAVYALLSGITGSGIDLDGQGEKVLIGRIAIMYGVVATCILVARFRDLRGQAASYRRGLEEFQTERIELSKAIHNTTAQSAYMIGLGIDAAIELADKSDRKLVANLEATQELAKSAMWELRHPIDIGLIIEGRELGRVLQSLTQTFSSITSIAADVVWNGVEPPLSPAQREALFSIAYNALTNSYRHSGATRVTVALEFDEDLLRLSIVDDGVGLPDDYADRGHGFRNMQDESEKIGGKLEVNRGGVNRGTTVSCVIPYERPEGGW